MKRQNPNRGKQKLQGNRQGRAEENVKNNDHYHPQGDAKRHCAHKIKAGY